MKASAFEFRFRLVLITLVIVLGFSAPWIELLHWGTRTTAWLWLGFEAGALGISPTKAIQLVTGLTIAVAAAAAAFRIWGTAYLGTGTVNNSEMKAGVVLADGPYRHVRNPLYIGSWLMVAAISVLMPPSGALFTMVLLSIFLLRLILGEEAFLREKLGEPYLAYCAKVSRLLPALTPRVPASGARPDWLHAAAAEIFMWGVTASFAVLGWRYDAHLLLQCVLVSLGASLIVRALQKKDPAEV